MRGPDLVLDLPAAQRHQHAVATRHRMLGLFLNGHASENCVLDRAERASVIEAARRVVPAGCLLVSEVNAESSLRTAGADGLYVSPPNSCAFSLDPACVVLHHRTVAAATLLPLMLYGAPGGAGAYEAATLRRLAGIDQAVAIQEQSAEEAQHQANLHLLTG